MTDTWIFLIRENDWDSDAYLPENLQGQDRTEFSEDVAVHERFQQAVADLGAKLVGSNALQNARFGGWVARGTEGGDGAPGDPVYTDAPFTDTNEVITGYYEVECDEATARRIAALVPSTNVVEWRKVMRFGS